MAILDIIIPHYKEDVALMEPMFSILKIQRNIKWTDFRVLIVNDGEDIVLPEGFGKDMPFEVKSITIPHGGISAARNAGLDYSQAEWIMFCDSDDAFLSTTSLQTYFKFMKKNKAMICSAFFEEALTRDERKPCLLWHDGKDYVFVHGKVFNRKWLLENNIRFNNELQLHEDTYMVAMARYLAGKNTTFIKDPLYLWQLNPKSVTRSYDNFVLQTYDKLCMKNAALVDEMLRRGMFVPAKGIVCRAITDAYNNLHRKSWHKKENTEFLADAEDCVAIFLQRYDHIFRNAGDVVIQVGLNDYKNRLMKANDFDETAPPFDEWVESLRKRKDEQ